MEAAIPEAVRLLEALVEQLDRGYQPDNQRCEAIRVHRRLLTALDQIAALRLRLRLAPGIFHSRLERQARRLVAQAAILVKSPTVGCIQPSEGRILADRVVRAAHAGWATRNQLRYDHSVNGARDRVDTWMKRHQLHTEPVWRLILERSGSRRLAIAIDAACQAPPAPTQAAMGT